ncbi:MAG TPA: hypothetical protein VFB27_04740 [Opitutaceae bacterium]|nr:hypothetical protein [Opitutaceae bacterium]
MSLKEQIRQKRIEQGMLPESCHIIKMQASTLQLEASSGKWWVLPWHHLVGCYLEGESEPETLRLTFVGYEAVVRGVNLYGLLQDIAKQRLASLRTAPKEYLRATGREAFVLEIEVCSSEGAIG